RMEVYNDPDSPNIVATFELPGVKNSDVSISVKQGMLLIQGQRHPRYPSRARAEADSRYFPFQELRYGSFRRSLRLPSGADTSSITASLSDGLLTVSWPR
ncbi:HSP20-like chaperone, partial [Mycena sp. CBHHK59/15]